MKKVNLFIIIICIILVILVIALIYPQANSTTYYICSLIRGNNNSYSWTKNDPFWEGYVHPGENFTGKWIDWHRNGIKRSECEYVNGKIHGSIIIWYDSGKIKSISQCRMGVISGITVYYKENSLEAIIENYNNGDLKYIESYYENGVRSEITFYNKDIIVPDGPFKEWYKNGQKKTEGVFFNFNKHNKWATWDREGNRLPDKWFYFGKEVTEQEFYKLDKKKFSDIIIEGEEAKDIVIDDDEEIEFIVIDGISKGVGLKNSDDAKQEETIGRTSKTKD